MLFFFFFNDTATTEIYTLSLHDALPIFWRTDHLGHGTQSPYRLFFLSSETAKSQARAVSAIDRKSTRLNSSHGYISYAVFCLKKKKNQRLPTILRVTSHVANGGNFEVKD